MASWGKLIAAVLSIVLLSSRLLRPRRERKVPRARERVLILGASSGIGRAIAHEYAARGARVCIVARREAELAKVIAECVALSPSRDGTTAFSEPADFACAEDMVRVRERVVQEWDGLDTLVVCAGVSALRPLMEVAGLQRLDGHRFAPAQADVEHIKHTVGVAQAALSGNYIGPLVSAVTFIPLLQASSAAPSVLLISSLAALVPPPTRSLYASTKAAAHMLFQVLAIEHPAVAFALAAPATVQGAFRASAVDGGPPRSAALERALAPDAVARRCVRAVDRAERMVFVPAVYGRGAHLLYWICPAFVEWRARAKYRFVAE